MAAQEGRIFSGRARITFGQKQASRGPKHLLKSVSWAVGGLCQERDCVKSLGGGGLLEGDLHKVHERSRKKPRVGRRGQECSRIPFPL